MRTWAIVVAAGGGTRFGAAKQFARLGDASVLDRAVGVALESCDGVVVVLPEGRDWPAPDGVRLAVGGASRSASVRSGRAALERAHACEGMGTDDAALVEAAGGTVVVVEGESRNFKITLAADLELAQALIEGAHA